MKKPIKWNLEIKSIWRRSHKGAGCMYRIESSSQLERNFEVYRTIIDQKTKPPRTVEALVGIGETLLHAQEIAETDFQEWLS